MLNLTCTFSVVLQGMSALLSMSNVSIKGNVPSFFHMVYNVCSSLKLPNVQKVKLICHGHLFYPDLEDSPCNLTYQLCLTKISVRMRTAAKCDCT